MTNKELLYDTYDPHLLGQVHNLLLDYTVEEVQAHINVLINYNVWLEDHRRQHSEKAQS